MAEPIARRLSLAFYLLLAWLLVSLGWWFFALAPLSATSPEWVAAARAVCFGSLPNGLPEGYGWITLVMTPLLVTTVLVVLWAADLSRDLRWLRSHPEGRLLLYVLVFVMTASVLWGVGRVRQVAQASQALSAPNTTPEELPEHYPRLAQPAPRFQLVDQHGGSLTNEDLLGRPVVLTFAFAHCQTICPGLVATLKSALEQVPEPRPGLVIITADPWRDTPAALPRLASGWQLGAQDHVLSGEVEQVLAVAEAFEVPLGRNLQNGDVTHPGMAFLLDSEGRLAYRFNDPSARWIVEALERLARSPR